MTTRTSVRPAIQAALAAALVARTELTGVTVMDGINARDATTEAIGIGPVQSIETTTPYMMNGRKKRIDKFMFEVGFRTLKPGQTAAQAKARAAEMFAALENFVADNATFQGLQSMQITGYDGPDADAVEGGFGAYVTARVQCHSELN